MQETRFDPWVKKIPWSRKWQTTPIFLPGKFHRQRRVGYSPWSHKESNTTEHIGTPHSWFSSYLNPQAHHSLGTLGLQPYQLLVVTDTARLRFAFDFELWCWRKLLRVPWTARRSNQSILKEISLGYSLEGLMLKLKLQYFGHLMWRGNPF